MLVPWTAVVWALVFAALATAGCWYRPRWAGVWCGVALVVAGWMYMAAVRAEMPPNYLALHEHLAGWGAIVLGGLMAIAWPGIAWIYRRNVAGRGPLTGEAADYADDAAPITGSGRANRE